MAENALTPEMRGQLHTKMIFLQAELRRWGYPIICREEIRQMTEFYQKMDTPELFKFAMKTTTKDCASNPCSHSAMLLELEIRGFGFNQ